MQVFPCPFCGLRDEREFHFVGEAGKVRPDTAPSETAAALPAKDWSNYLYTQQNNPGLVREIWMHLPCQEVFLLERHATTMEVVGATPFRDAPTEDVSQ